MAKDFSSMELSNFSKNPSIHQVSDPTRRKILVGGLATLTSSLLAPLLANAQSQTASSSLTGKESLIGFESIPVTNADGLFVPKGYTARPAFMWGEPVGINSMSPEWKSDASNSAADQEAQIGMHHDGMHYFPLDGSKRGLLVMNHEYTDDGLLHQDGMSTWSAEKVKKSMAAHGVSVIEVQESGGEWQMVRPSQYARRITAYTPMTVAGPASGHPLMKTEADPTGTRVLGTLNNCAHGYTPWGTYLTCEENFAFYFNGQDKPTAHEKRWGLVKNGRGYRWHEHEPRFNVADHPNEPNRFGWVVEIDPLDPNSTPIKRTALGRAAHEGAWVTQTKDGRAVVYMGEDAQFEYIYKFVSRDPVKPGGYAANRELLDHGTLYVAKFNDDNTGRWLEISQGKNNLTSANGFENQGDVLIKSRQASDQVGATKMDRPEWIAIDPNTNEVYCTLTNNSRRGNENRPAVDAANPRSKNTMGNIIKWKESGDFDAEQFTWAHFVMAGDPNNDRAEAKGNIKGDRYGSPDGLWFDARGVMWIQTDAHATNMYKGDYAGLGNNMMLAADPRTGETRRFLVGPVNCEVTGVICTPDMRTMFVNIQHPGESPTDRSDPQNPTKYSSWPSGNKGARPRSATVIIRKDDGGVIGT